MSNEKNVFTKEGYKKQQKELEHLKTVVRAEIAAKLSEAVEYGDLSENAAYQSAMEQRDMNEARIAEMEDTLANAKIVKADKQNSDGKISVGDKIVLEGEDGEKIDFEIVGAGEADLATKKFSANSPLVAAILGKKKGAKVEINLPIGTKKYTVLKVN